MGRLEEPRWLWRGTVPSLNGLRAVSVAIVLAVHSLHQANVPSHWLPIQGSTGVDVFFVISGFLITLLLLREQRNTGTISLRQFYLQPDQRWIRRQSRDSVEARDLRVSASPRLRGEDSIVSAHNSTWMPISNTCSLGMR